jgi:tetratricopeptide (TPR) repeat protein
VEPAMTKSAAWHEMMGYTDFKVGDTVNAVAEIQKAMDLDPSNQDYILELSEVFVANNNGGAAVTLLNVAKKAFPTSARIWFALGVAYLIDENRTAAEVSLRKSLELDPKLDLALVVLGQGYKETGQWNDLLETADRLIQVNGRNAIGYYYKAVALLESSSRDETQIETLLKKSVALRAEDPGPHYELAKLLAKKGDKEAALRELEQIIKAHPDFGPAYYQLYRLYREKGAIGKSVEAQQAHARIQASEREQVTRKLLLEVRQRGAL